MCNNENNDKYNIKTIKIILIGPSNSGKTSLINKFLDKSYDILYHKNIPLTIGCDFYLKKIKIENDDLEYKLHIWDTSGNNKYNNMHKILNDMDKIIIVFDKTNINNDEEYYINIAKKYRNEKDILIVYNKTSIKDPLIWKELIINNINTMYINLEYNIDIDKIFYNLLNLKIKNINYNTFLIKQNNKCNIL